MTPTNKYLSVIIFLISSLVASCDDYLSEVPDNRTEVTTEQNIKALITSAYPTTSAMYMGEYSSDNVDDYGKSNPYTDLFIEQVAYWRDVTESTGQEDPYALWSRSYKSISAANQALEAIEKKGNPTQLQPFKAEALLCRAYAHFILVNVFCQHYTDKYAATDLGIPYVKIPETQLFVEYNRITVDSVYKEINRDIEEALPFIKDNYNVPKYHFNTKAAYAFATRFNLYRGNWEKAIAYADKALTSNPTVMMRNMSERAKMTREEEVYTKDYIRPEYNCNLMLMTAMSRAGMYFGNYFTMSRITHGALIAEYETLKAAGPWGSYDSYYVLPFIYEGTNLDKTLTMKLPFLFEYLDPVAMIGYPHTVYTAFSTEETLLARAEAYIMKEKYTEALGDLNIWIKANVKEEYILTEEAVEKFINEMHYYEPNAPTPRKKLNPSFALNSGKQENFIQLLLFIRRIQTIHEGLRWFDVKRYGIEVDRRIVNTNGKGVTVADKLTPRDPRAAIQLPQEVINAGIPANPR